MRIESTLRARAPLTIFELTGAQGDTLDAEQRMPAPRSAIVQVMMFVEGEVAVQRVEGTPNEDGAPWIWRPGMITADRPGRDNVINPGTFRMTVLTPTAKYFCVTRPDRKRMNHASWKPIQGTELHLTNRAVLFVAKGTVVVRGVTYVGPITIAAASAWSAAALSDDVFGLIVND